MLKTVIRNAKILAAFIVVDIIVTMLLLVVTGASFVMMNSITFKVMAAIISIVLTSVICAVFEKRSKI